MRFHCGDRQQQAAQSLAPSTKKVAADAEHLAATSG